MATQLPVALEQEKGHGSAGRNNARYDSTLEAARSICAVSNRHDERRSLPDRGSGRIGNRHKPIALLSAQWTRHSPAAESNQRRRGAGPETPFTTERVILNRDRTRA